MATASSATPLLALDAVAIDTETTGLDARKARIVEIALVPIVAGRLDAGAACRRLIRPDVAIPAQATRIHGIDAAAVADAPRFAEAWPELAALIGERRAHRPLGRVRSHGADSRMRACGPAVDAPARVGHAAVGRGGRAGPRGLLARERCSVAGDRGQRIAIPPWATRWQRRAHSWHCCRGCAKCGIRTLAEAERACNALTDALEKQHRAGWLEPSSGSERRRCRRGAAALG